MKKLILLSLLLFLCFSIKAQTNIDGFQLVGSIATPDFNIEGNILISPDGKHLITRHGHKPSKIDIYDIATWQKAHTFTVKGSVFAVNGFFEKENPSVFYLTGMGYKKHKFNLVTQEHDLIRERRLSASEKKKFRTSCDNSFAVTSKKDGLTTHTLKGQYIIRKHEGITHIYLADDLLKTTSTQ